MTSLILFLASFMTVFALGFQSLNVNRGHFFAAAIGSILIGICNLTIYRLMLQATQSIEMIAYVMGGHVGIVCAMYCHGKLSRKRQSKLDQLK